jgi:hypothetical protein
MHFEKILSCRLTLVLLLGFEARHNKGHTHKYLLILMDVRRPHFMH